MQENKLTPGSINGRSNVEYVPLDWRAIPLLVDSHGTVHPATVGEIAEIDGNGLYVIEGSHDAHPTGCILYVGESGKSGSGNQLGKRIVNSLGLGKRTEKLANGDRLWSTFWNITLRWADITGPQPTIKRVESLLIQAHLPPLNSHEIRGFYKGSPGLTVLNAGAKGRLLPCLVSDYYLNALWDGAA